jgi:predicted transcriptional regulator
VEDQIIDLTAQIVLAHVAANDVLPDQLPALIRDVHEALSTVGQAPAEPVKAEPAVAANRSVFADHILCLDCGGNFKMLKRHLSTDHQTTPETIPNQMGSATVIPDCGARICCGAIEAGLGQRLGTKGSGGAAAEEAWATEKGVTGSRGLSRRQRKRPNCRLIGIGADLSVVQGSEM